MLGNPAGDMDALVAALKAKAEITPEGDPILGWNYDDTMLAEKRHPTRHDLDRASTRHPIYIGHISGHMGVANSRALAKYNVTRETTVSGVVKDEIFQCQIRIYVFFVQRGKQQPHQSILNLSSLSIPVSSIALLSMLIILSLSAGKVPLSDK